jgi:hypothetical protein
MTLLAIVSLVSVNFKVAPFLLMPSLHSIPPFFCVCKKFDQNKNEESYSTAINQLV